MNPFPNGPRICLITRGAANAENYEVEKKRILETVVAAVADGVRFFQIREKLLPARLLFDLVQAAVHSIEPDDAIVMVNERADVAVAAGADGVHLPETGVPPNLIRSVFGKELIIGASIHSAAAATAAADYFFFGPVFETPGKTAVGVDQLAAVSQQLAPFPVIAIGGIDEDNLSGCLEHGAAGVAAIRALNDASSRRAMISRLKV